MDNDVIVSWLPLFHDMGMTGFLTVPMYFGAELVKVTPMDFLSDTLLWARADRQIQGHHDRGAQLRVLAVRETSSQAGASGPVRLSSLRWALSGAEQVDPADVEDLVRGGRAVRAATRGDPAGLRHGRNDCGSVVLRYAAPAWSSTRSMPTCSGHWAAPFRRQRQQDRRLATLGPLLTGLEARVVDDRRSKCFRRAASA